MTYIELPLRTLIMSSISSVVSWHWSWDRKISYLKGNEPFLKFVILYLASILSIYAICDKPITLFLWSWQSPIFRITLVLPRSYVLNWFNNRILTIDNILISFLMIRISITYKIEMLQHYHDVFCTPMVHLAILQIQRIWLILMCHDTDACSRS